MNPSVALPPAGRLTDLLSSDVHARDELKRQAVSDTLNVLKKRGRRFHLSLDDVDASIQNDKEFLELTATSSPVREADLAELQRRLNEAMMKLSDEHRAVVTMFHIQGMPHAEISKILKVSEGTVRSRLFYANRQLQNYLDEFRKNPVS